MLRAVVLVLCLVVFVFAVIQSVFGVGLLVFGTPTLLLLGLPFDAVLAYLPSSIAISLLQVVGGGGFRLDPLRRQFLLLTAPLVLLGTLLILTAGVGLEHPVLGGRNARGDRVPPAVRAGAGDDAAGHRSSLGCVPRRPRGDPRAFQPRRRRTSLISAGWVRPDCGSSRSCLALGTDVSVTPMSLTAPRVLHRAAMPPA